LSFSMDRSVPGQYLQIKPCIGQTLLIWIQE
jgi:hypothetical protein